MSSSWNQAPAKTFSSFKVVLNAMFGPNPKYTNFFNGTDSTWSFTNTFLPSQILPRPFPSAYRLHQLFPTSF